MKSEAQRVEHFHYNLDESKPIEALHHLHTDHKGWFDMHYELEMGIVLSGKMQRSYEAKEIELGPGDVWFCNMWEPHGFAIIEAPCEVVVFEIFPTSIHSRALNYNWLHPFNSSVRERPQTTDVQRNEILELGQKVIKELNHDNDQVRLQLLLMEAIHLVSRNTDKAQTVDQHKINQHRLTPAMNLVFQERRFIPLQEAAQCCAMSKSGFSLLFSKMMGTSFAKFALNYRIQGAIHEYGHSDKKLESVATEWGFTDASHLHKYLVKK